MSIGSVISKAIKEGKWLDIVYMKKDSEEKTYFWAAINDIDIKRKSFKADIYNDRKSLDSLEGNFYFDNIVDARVIDFTTYQVPVELTTKIENYIVDLDWLEYDNFNHNILDYYKECNYLDNDPFQKEYCMIPGIDVDYLRKNRYVYLNEEQIKIIINKIYRYDIKNDDLSNYDLAISVLSIDNGNKKYVVCYYDLFFDPKNKTLELGNTLKFNKSFLIEGRKHSLFNYINMDVDTFIDDFEDNYFESVDLIRGYLSFNEVINERPDIFLLERDYTVDLALTYDKIEQHYNEKKLSVPLKAFFGNLTTKDIRRRKEPTIAIYDDKININQMRVIYNAMKYPLTYVQGPPGTGKTQTIVNVILSAFFDNKTVLVCSSNNKPVDGIIEKFNFLYREEKIIFPYLRLGKFEEILKALDYIKSLYEFETNKVAKEDKINRIFEKAKNDNSELIKLLNRQEKREEYENFINNSDKLFDSLKGVKNHIIDNIHSQINLMKDELKDLKEVKNSEVLALVTPINKNDRLQQLLYFKSLGFIKKLHEPKFKTLIDICYIEDEKEKVTEFNKWSNSDANMKLLTSVFPIICSTNISTSKLGSGEFMFDLVIMDEAGQCNVAHALLPIARANNLLLVGDKNQLKPVIVLEKKINEQLMTKYEIDDNYNYKEKSILDVFRLMDPFSVDILLKYHYRCGKKIIKFSNDRYYNSELDLSYLKEDGELKFLNVKNLNQGERHAELDEANAIIDYIKRNNVKNVTILTPFVNQKDLINNLLIQNGINDIKCGTIHSLQGDEKDSIIFSTAISLKTSKATYNWLKNNFEIINVGITRCKKKLIISADKEALLLLSDKSDDLYQLINYVSENGNVVVPQNESIRIEIGKSNGSKNEQEFFKTISQICSLHQNFDAKTNVDMKEIFTDYIFNLLSSKKEFDLVIYEKRKDGKLYPKIIVEENGGEHMGSICREQSDNYKRELAAKNGIRFIMIDNSFRKSYTYIKTLIENSKKEQAKQLELEI
ncbi:MAG: AAA domain-containing protein [Bacilli bacterium]|nr:AAA domain-containing protein [Bacilli bacterium]